MKTITGVRRWMRVWPLLVGGGLSAWGLQRPLPPSPSTHTGLAALADTGFTLLLWGYLTLEGAALGERVLRWLQLPGLSSRERLLWSIPTGLILLGYPVYALGLLGLLRPPIIAGLILGLALYLRQDMEAAAREIVGALRIALASLEKAPPTARWGGWLMATLLGFSFLIALTPPTEYDALWYHLEAPRRFLEAGRIYPDFHNWPANFAFGTSMLYAIPLALGDDIVPQLLHWTFGLAFLGLTLALARPYAGEWAWVSPAFMLTMPALTFRLMPSALADIPAACLELMAFGALLRSSERRDPGWLHAAGIWMGLAIGAKISSLPILATGVAFWIWRGFPMSIPDRVRSLIPSLILTLILAAPWYLKNALWFGTPLFPAWLRSNDPEVNFTSYLYQEYINSRGTTGLGRAIFFIWALFAPEKIDYVGLPWVAPLGLLISVLFTRWLPVEVIGFAGARAILWALGPPGIRFLLSALALWGIGIAAALSACSSRNRWHRFSTWAMTRGLLALLALLVAAGELHMLISRPWAAALGMESRVDFLRRALSGYRGMEWVQSHLKPEERILLIGDTRHYYCPDACFPEADHFTWARIVWAAGFDPEAVARRLEAMGITHLWIHHGTIKWLLNHDPEGWVRRSEDFLRIRFAPGCAHPVYADEDVEILRLTCIEIRNAVGEMTR